MNKKNIFEYLLKLKNKAILHLNVSTYDQFKAAIEASKETKIPLIIGVSEGERKYWGINYIEDLIDEAKEQGINVFLNADHCKSFKSAKEAIDLKFDFVLFDGSELSLNENLKITKKVVDYKNKISPNTLIEGEIGYLKGHSDIEGNIEIKKEYFTNPNVALDFVEKTNVNLLAISVGNIHGIPKNVIFEGKIYKKPKIDFNLIKNIKDKVKIPLVLHGGSGLSKKDYLLSIKSGINIIHINTEIRVLWKKLLSRFIIKGKTSVPYNILSPIKDKIKLKIIYYQKLFWSA
jgi:fructose-bisphosphate aldolase class II